LADNRKWLSPTVDTERRHYHHRRHSTTRSGLEGHPGAVCRLEIWEQGLLDHRHHHHHGYCRRRALRGLRRRPDRYPGEEEAPHLLQQLLAARAHPDRRDTSLTPTP